MSFGGQKIPKSTVFSVVFFWPKQAKDPGDCLLFTTKFGKSYHQSFGDSLDGLEY